MRDDATTDEALRADLLRACYAFEDIYTAGKLLLAECWLERAYSELQPRVPAGQPAGGQWTGPGGATLVPAVLDGPQQYHVYLPDEEVDGGHTIRRHVLGLGQDDELIQRVIDGSWRTAAGVFGPYSEGAFYSVESANDFINRALEANTATVDAVASSGLPEATINLRFGYVTGREAHTNSEEDPYIRPTYSVRVVIRHDTRSPRGYRVFTAFPINLKPDGSEDIE